MYALNITESARQRDGSVRQNALPRPLRCEVNANTVPYALKERPQWVGWEYKLDADTKKFTKVPLNSRTGRRAQSNNPATWSTYEIAIEAYRKQDRIDGIGFMFSAEDGLVGIDIDHVIDVDTGEINQRAQEILERFQGTYCEVSPSGTGFRIFTYGSPGRIGKNEGTGKWLEVYNYTSPRYLTVTGHKLSVAAAEVVELQESLDWLHEKYFKPATKPDSKPAPALSLTVGDTALLDKARSARNGDHFRALFDRGDTSAYGGDDSAADLALCSLLAFWTQKEAGRIDRLFRQSRLMRPKWDSRRGATTYGQMTVDKAIADCRETYSEHRPNSNGNGHDIDPPNIGQDDPGFWNYHDSLEFKSVMQDDSSQREVRKAKEETKSATLAKHAFIDIADLCAAPPKEAWTIRGYFSPDSLIMVIGDPEAGKSFFLIDLSCHIATGREWRGIKAKQGKILYIAGEGKNGLGKRFRAWFEHYGEQPRDITLLASPIQLTDVAGMAALAEEIKALPQTHDVIIIDTINRNFGLGDENKTADMTLAVAGLDTLRSISGACVIGAHHCGLLDKSRGRGSSVLRGSLDFEYILERDDRTLTLKCSKSKDSDRPEQLAWEFQQQSLPWADEDGVQINSVVLVPTDMPEQPSIPKSDRLGAKQETALKILRRLYKNQRDNLADSGLSISNAKVSRANWLNAMESAGIPKSSRYEMPNTLQERGLIRNEGCYVFPLDLDEPR